jgi:hypothetical protein
LNMVASTAKRRQRPSAAKIGSQAEKAGNWQPDWKLMESYVNAVARSGKAELARMARIVNERLEAELTAK